MLLGHFIPTPIHAADWSTINARCVDDGVATITGIKCLISNVVAAAAPLIALSAVFIIILGGVKILLGGENPKTYAAGIDTIIYAIIGIISLGLAWLILVAIERFTGAPVTEMRFGF